MREVAAAEKALRQKPKVTRPKAVPGRKVRMNVAAIDLPRPKEHRFVGGSATHPLTSSRRATRRSKPAKRLAQIKFLLLCILLATLLLIVWRNFPG